MCLQAGREYSSLLVRLTVTINAYGKRTEIIHHLRDDQGDVVIDHTR